MAKGDNTCPDHSAARSVPGRLETGPEVLIALIHHGAGDAMREGDRAAPLSALAGSRRCSGEVMGNAGITQLWASPALRARETLERWRRSWAEIRTLRRWRRRPGETDAAMALRGERARTRYAEPVHGVALAASHAT